MADVTITVPPPEGSISIQVGQTLGITARHACNFCCSIGGNFSPSIASIQLNAGDNGPYTAQTTGSGKYNTSTDKPCDPNEPSPVLMAQSVQITPP